MKNKKTLLLSAAAILIVVLLVGVFVMYRKIETARLAISEAGAQQKVDDHSGNQNSFVFIDGSVVSFGKNILEIQNGQTKKALRVDENVQVFSIQGKNSEKKSFSDLKSGIEVNAKIDAKTSMVEAIEILP